MDEVPESNDKKKGFFGSILRRKTLASRAKSLKVFRAKAPGSASPGEGAKLSSRPSEQDLAGGDAPIKARRALKKGLPEGADQRRVNGGNMGTMPPGDKASRRRDGLAGTAVVEEGSAKQANDSVFVQRKANEDGIRHKRSRVMEAAAEPVQGAPRSSRRRPRRPKPIPHKDQNRTYGAGRGKRTEELTSDEETLEPPPLTEWPPRGLNSSDQLPPPYAAELIVRGAPIHRGHKRALPLTTGRRHAFYTTTSGPDCLETDAAGLHGSMTALMTMRLQGPGRPEQPWETLEQPSCAFLFGVRPGTITLNHWISAGGFLPQALALRDSGVLPRSMTLYRIMERLKELQAGLEDDDEGLLYRILYKRILRDPERILNPHRTLDKQITDLLLVLSRPHWIDFADPKNQVATRFIFNVEFVNTDLYTKFFHQLLLSLELDLRIQSKQHTDWAKARLLAQIPPIIQWNLALARRWKDHVRIDVFGTTPEHTVLRYKLKKRQIKVLRKFAETMRWPNLNDTMESLRIHEDEAKLDAISSDAFAFFSGLILPGSTFPFLIMNTLIDLDPDSATDNLALLSHTYPQCGFQYRNSHTYWSASCVVGKVLAPTGHALAGWIGPCRPTADLGRSQIARIRTRRPKHQDGRLGPEDVESMGERSDPLGPSAQSYPIDDYSLIVPDHDSFAVDTVRVEMLALKPVVTMAEDTFVNGPRSFDATVQFAINSVSWPLRLMYDVSFVTAWPCSQPPHPLFFDYVHRVVKADEIVRVRDWGGLYYKNLRQGSASMRSSPAPPGYSMGFDEELDFVDDDGDDEKVLVVEAYGVPDNEVLARAWCSHWGLSAMVADIKKTCMACAIREAYAATITVVIMVDSQYDESRNDDG